MADNNGTALPHETDSDISTRTVFVELIYLPSDVKTINCHINLLDYYLRQRSTPPVISIICRPDFRALVGVHLRTFIILHGYFSLGKTSGPTTKAAGSKVLL